MKKIEKNAMGFKIEIEWPFLHTDPSLLLHILGGKKREG